MTAILDTISCLVQVSRLFGSPKGHTHVQRSVFSCLPGSAKLHQVGKQCWTFFQEPGHGYGVTEVPLEYPMKRSQRTDKHRAVIRTSGNGQDGSQCLSEALAFANKVHRSLQCINGAATSTQVARRGDILDSRETTIACPHSKPRRILPILASSRLRHRTAMAAAPSPSTGSWLVRASSMRA